MAEQSFDITWRNGAYYVSIPNYKGGTVYTSEYVDGLLARLAAATEVIKPFAMICKLDVKETDGDLTSVYPMVAAGRLRAARDFMNAPVGGEKL
jgi:hypothetical protein